MALAFRRLNQLQYLAVKGVSVRCMNRGPEKEEPISRLGHDEKEGMSKLKEMYFHWQGFNQYGLLRDDIRHELDPDVEEAVRRLPKKLKEERDFRGLRAIQASIQNTILPKELWTKPTDNHYYLDPYVEEVKREREERENWEKTH